MLAVMKEKAMVSIGMASCNLGVEGAKVVAEMAAVSRSLSKVIRHRFKYASAFLSSSF